MLGVTDQQGPKSKRGRFVKIAVFVHYLPPHVGGIEVISESQIKALLAAGQDVMVISSACSSEPGLSKVDGYEARRIRAWNYFEEKMGAAFPIYSPALVWHGYKAVRAADIVHAHDAFYLTSLTAAIWARILRKPLILTQHVGMVPHPNKLVNLIQQLVYATTGRFILRSSRAILVLNSRVRKFVLGKGIEESKIMFLPNGVDTSTFTPAARWEKRLLRRKYNLPEDKLLALFAGRFVAKKGFAKLLGLKSIKNLEVVFVGGDVPAGHMRDDHHFLGSVSRERMPEVFKMCDIFMLPSQGEGFPVTVQEAMASGLSVITTADPAYGPYNLDESLVQLVEPTTSRFSAALQMTVNDPELRREMSRYSRAYALANFDWRVHVTQLLSIYDSNLKTSGRRRGIRLRRLSGKV
jgi:D-inositol-3-phosphate glycosyltransferase